MINIILVILAVLYVLSPYDILPDMLVGWGWLDDLAILGFDEVTKRMKVQALHAGVSAEQVRERTGFELLFDDRLENTEPPTDDELAVLREFDPDRVYIA